MRFDNLFITFNSKTHTSFTLLPTVSSSLLMIVLSTSINWFEFLMVLPSIINPALVIPVEGPPFCNDLLSVKQTSWSLWINISSRIRVQIEWNNVVLLSASSAYFSLLYLIAEFLYMQILVVDFSILWSARAF